MLTFRSRITNGGNLKLSSQLLDALNAEPDDEFVITINDSGLVKPHCCGNCEDCLSVPPEYFEMAGIDPESKIEIYANDGVIRIKEVDEDA